jgi:hypothetical protein
MKKLLVTLAAVLVSASTFGQGTVAMNTRTTGVDAPVFLPGGTIGAGAHTAPVNAQLFLVSGGTRTAIAGSETTFRQSPAGLAQAYVNAISSVAVNGIAGGSPATLVLRAWSGPSYDAAVAGNGEFFGESPQPITITLGGAGSPPGLPANLTGLAGFTLQAVPEPSTLALGLLGAAALLYRRRS